MMASYVRSGQFTPIYLVAGQYVGALKIMVPRGFATTNKHKIQWEAQLLVLSCCLLLPILVILYQNWNPMLAFMWIGEAYVFLILIPYTLTGVANIVYHFRYRLAEIN